MRISLERFDNGVWSDLTSKLTGLTHSLAVREMEKLELELLDETVGVGERVRLLRNSTPVFEGVVYERERIQQDIFRTRCIAYTDLVLYEAHIVYRHYPTGTSAGEIIRDLAALVENVDTADVDDGPRLTSDWIIQNEKALEVMKKVARGTNHHLRMRPGRRLYFKAKTVGAPRFTLDRSMVISANYTEDRWKIRNRVIYVGSGGAVLADVSEPPADLPLVVHDPFLTDVDEAMRRARVRLEMSREYGRQLDVEIHKTRYELLGVDVGDAVQVNLPNLDLQEAVMIVVEILYQPHQLRTRLTLGGRLEYFEELLGEMVGGETASLFGQHISIPEFLTTITNTMNSTLRLQSRGRTVRLLNSPPIRVENASNIIVEDGYASLIAGATSGSFECSCLPPSQLFKRWLRTYYSYELGGGAVSADLLRADDTLIAGQIPQDYELPYYPHVSGSITEGNSSEWGVVGGVLSDSRNAVISGMSIRADKTGSSMTLYYPNAKNAGLDISAYKYLTIYLYSVNDDPNIVVRLATNDSNYYEAVLNHVGGAWNRYEVAMKTMRCVGQPTTINWFEIGTSLPRIYVDTDYLLTPAGREKLRLQFRLTRPSANMLSPKITNVKFVWREGL